MKLLYKRRLLKLAKHLETKRIKGFDMSDYKSCALSENPKLFKEWTKDELGLPLLKKHSTHVVYMDTKIFFGISEDIFLRLFHNEMIYDQKRKQVAASIRAYVKSLKTTK